MNPPEYKHILEDVHTPQFEDKVDFLSSLSPFKPLRNETVRKLAPCFQMVVSRGRWRGAEKPCFSWLAGSLAGE